ncbi:probable E3 ubiquitin-protein ligase ARI9 isoform X1 [Salvia splendens]|uniref:probable E3 ubiquitin-protein ligase ARI9 isoform X1 n=1 Tax=Salvia splendens TaxID=180675 RepID=UPI001C266875|nr:probable E3 ubiquitin-protein ligase ARI9 isoform X1 [Salvia splendens]
MADDSEMAYNLQLEEAIAASLLDGAAAPPPATAAYDALIGWEQDAFDDEVEAERLRLDLLRQVHDRALACEIMSVPDEEWLQTGNNLHRPFGEGSSSSSSSNGQNFQFKVYVKGLVERGAGGIGVAICDGNDGLLFELSKGLSGKDQDTKLVDFKALIEGLDAAVMLDLKRITVVTDNPLLYQHITGENTQMIKTAVALSNQIQLLLRKFTKCQPSLVASNVNKSVKLARNAIAFQVNRSAGSSNGKNLTEQCTICLEDTYVDRMFLISSCRHSYCFLCLSKHVQFKLLQGRLPKCPHEKCETELKLESCKEFLTPELLEIMSQRVKEASIPADDKIYCPYPRCSNLLSKKELRGSTYDGLLKCRKCPKCSGNFCIDCQVPWHKDMQCSEFKRRNPNPCNEDKVLESLASRNLWRQCPKCSHMVSLASGCYHIYCRCGHEFCYTCGAEWKNKKATCKCPIWDERNLIYEQNRQQDHWKIPGDQRNFCCAI